MDTIETPDTGDASKAAHTSRVRRAGLITALIFGLTGGVAGIATAADDDAPVTPDTAEHGDCESEPAEDDAA